MRVFVTGAAGYIGSHTVRCLLQEAHEVAILVSPSTDLSLISDLIGQVELVSGRLHEIEKWASTVERFRPECLVHLAWCANPTTYLTSPSNLDHLHWSIALVRFLLSIDCRRLVVAGTCFEYAPTTQCLREASPLGPQTLYAASKASLFLLLPHLVHAGAATLAWARIFHSLGPGEARGRLVPAAIAALRADRDFAATPGEQRRDYLDVRDIATALRTLATSDTDGVFNVSSGRTIAVRELLTRLSVIVGGTGSIRFGALPMRAAESSIIWGDNRRLLELGWSPHYGLDESLRDALAWWRAQSAA